MLLAFYGLFMIGCRKEENAEKPPAKQVCSLQSIVRSGKTFYDSTVATLDGGIPGYWQLHKGISSGAAFSTDIVRKQFLADGNKIYIVDPLDDRRKDTLIVDQNMRILESRTRELYENCGWLDTTFTTRKFQTDNSGQLWRVLNFYRNTGTYISSTDTLLFTFENGDLMSITQRGAPVYTYTYYPYSQQQNNYVFCANLYNIMGFLTNGAFEYRNTHLVKRATQNNSFTDYSYVLDEVDGKVLQATYIIDVRGTQFPVTENYHYDCH